MALTSKLGRPMMAAMFISGGIDALRTVRQKAEVIDPVADKIAEPLGLPEDPETLVKINAAVQITAGSLLALGKAPRLAATALAGSVVATTYGAHRFWEEDDPQTRQQQQVHFFKNVAMLGGLVIAAGDREGRPSLGWRARRKLSRSKPKTAELGESLPTKAAETSDHLREFAEQKGPVVESQLRELAERARPVVEARGDQVREFAEQKRPVVESQLRELAERARPVVEARGDQVRELADRAAPKVKKARRKALARARDVAAVAAPALAVASQRAVDSTRHAADRAAPVVESAVRTAGERAAELRRAG